jgi:lipoprotein-releasing system permease protein
MKAAFPAALGFRMLRGKAGTARYLRGAVLGIALGLVPLMVVLEVSTGMIDGITERLIEIEGYHLNVTLPVLADRSDMELALREILQNPEVTDAVPERQGVGLLFRAGRSTGVTLRMVPPDYFNRDAGLRKYVTFSEGSADLSAPSGILIGSALAKILGAKAGDKVLLLTPYEGSEGRQALEGKLPKVTPLTVAGVFQTGYQEIEKVMAFASLDSAWGVLSDQTSKELIGVKVKSPYGDLQATAADLRSRLTVGNRIQTWRERESSQLAYFGIIKALLVFIMALIVVVAAVNVSSSVIMIAFERRFEIGILKSIGASPASIASSFLLAGFATGLLGTAGGVLIGLAASVNINGIIAFLQACVDAFFGAGSALRYALLPSAAPIEPLKVFNSAYYLVTIPIRIQWMEVAVAAAGTLALSGIAAYIPARRAASAAPLEIIRKV